MHRAACRSLRIKEEPEVYVCPRCGARSHHPRDAAERYCVRCHLFEGRERAKE